MERGYCIDGYLELLDVLVLIRGDDDELCEVERHLQVRDVLEERQGSKLTDRMRTIPWEVCMSM